MTSPLDHFRRDLLPSWPSYAAAHDMDLRGAGAERRMNCGVHGGENFSLCINAATGTWLCQACGAAGGDVLDYHQAAHGIRFVEAARELGAWDDTGSSEQSQQRPPKVHNAPSLARSAPTPDEQAATARKRALATRVWAASLPIEPKTPAGMYLLGRACVLPPPDSDLRWLPDLHLFGIGGPALIGRMSLATDYREARGLHITWLEPDCGGWHRLKRRYLGPKSDCVLRLWPDDFVTHGLGIGEGVETCLSLAHAYTPVWCGLDAGGLAAFPVLAGIESLVIAADHGEAGVAAAEGCAARWAERGRAVHIVMTEANIADINDAARLPA